MSAIAITCQPRDTVGKAEARRLRRLQGMAPGVIYGGDKPNTNIMVDEKVLYNACENESFFSQILQLKVGKDTDDVITRAIQRHPYKQQILHIDFLRVSQTTEIQLSIPLHFINEEDCIGVKQQGGTIIHEVYEVLVSCLPKNLPQAIEIDVSKLEINHSIHLSELSVPEGVTFPDLQRDDDHDITVVRVTKMVEQPEESDDIGEEAGQESGEEQGESESE